MVLYKKYELEIVKLRIAGVTIKNEAGSLEALLPLWGITYTLF